MLKAFCWSGFLYLLVANCLFAQVNHAPLDPKHSFVAENFLDRHMRTAGEYDLMKIHKFIERLEKDYEAFKSDVYENTIIESIDIRLDTIEQARENARKEIREGKHDHLYAYQKYLMPAIHEIARLVEVGAAETIDAMVDKFIELYHVYFVPNHVRNRYNFDVDILNSTSCSSSQS